MIFLQQISDRGKRKYNQRFFSNTKISWKLFIFLEENECFSSLLWLPITLKTFIWSINRLLWSAHLHIDLRRRNWHRNIRKCIKKNNAIKVGIMIHFRSPISFYFYTFRKTNFKSGLYIIYLLYLHLFIYIYIFKPFCINLLWCIKIVPILWLHSLKNRIWKLWWEKLCNMFALYVTYTSQTSIFHKFRYI